MSYTTWRRIMAHGESVAIRHLHGHTLRWAPAVYHLDDYYQAANAHRRPGRAEVRARRARKAAAA